MSEKREGKFIVLEGPSHTGKSIQTLRLVEELKKLNIPAIDNAEPTNRNIFGTMIRVLTDQIPIEAVNRSVLDRELRRALAVLLDYPFWQELSEIIQKVLRREPVSELERQILFIVDRYFDLRNNINPHAELGIWIVQDRYELSTFAYGTTQGLDVQELKSWQNKILGALYRKPDLSIFIDASPEAIVRRQSLSGKKQDQYEAIHNLELTRKAYQDVIRSMGEGYRVVRIDGDKTQEKVFEALVQAVKKEFSL
jgi:dTMP kinase